MSTCANESVTGLEARNATRTERVRTPLGQQVEQEVEYSYNVTLNLTESRCERLMKAPAANPCPWSRDCKLLGEVSFKLRAYALRTGYVASQTASGLYTFIQAGFPQWMNTNDDCGGWRQSTAHPHLKYAVSRDDMGVLAPYDCRLAGTGHRH